MDTTGPQRDLKLGPIVLLTTLNFLERRTRDLQWVSPWAPWLTWSAELTAKDCVS
jgi:hypothetical protein